MSSPLDKHANNVSGIPVPKENTAEDGFGWNAGPKEITSRAINEALIGREVSRACYVDSQARKRELKQQSEDLIARLERIGIDGRSGDGNTFMVGLVSGQAERIPNFRNCNLIPSVQSRNIHDMQRHVQYLADTTKPGRLRMLVVSAGWCPAVEYRSSHKALTRRMSKFAAHSKLKELGIEVQFYNVENTIHRDDNGRAMVNLHSHALFKCRRYLGKRWTEFLDFARGYFPKGYVHDSKIENPREVVKYVFKPSEFDLLTDGELAELWHQVVGGRPKFDPETGEIETRSIVVDDGEQPYADRGQVNMPFRCSEQIIVREGPLKFFHPLGSMRRFRSYLTKNGQKLIQVPTVDGRWIWRATEKKKPQTQDEPVEGNPRDNLVLARTAPMPMFTPRREPCAIVRDYTGDFAAMVRQNGLERVVSEARRIFDGRVQTDKTAAREAQGSPWDAPPIRDTTTTTVREGGTAPAVRPPPPRGTSPDCPWDSWLQ